MEQKFTNQKNVASIQLLTPGQQHLTMRAYGNIGEKFLLGKKFWLYDTGIIQSLCSS